MGELNKPDQNQYSGTSEDNDLLSPQISAYVWIESMQRGQFLNMRICFEPIFQTIGHFTMEI
jgi:hypothetical protein